MHTVRHLVFFNLYMPLVSKTVWANLFTTTTRYWNEYLNVVAVNGCCIAFWCVYSEKIFWVYGNNFCADGLKRCSYIALKCICRLYEKFGSHQVWWRPDLAGPSKVFIFNWNGHYTTIASSRISVRLVSYLVNVKPSQFMRENESSCNYFAMQTFPYSNKSLTAKKL